MRRALSPGSHYRTRDLSPQPSETYQSLYRNSYKDDPSIVGFEINNEPCHSGTKEEVKAYINRMLEAIHRTGNRKPVFYNVSHNEYVVEAYYETAIKALLINGILSDWYPDKRNKEIFFPI